MGGSVTPEETPGGGLTMVVSLTATSVHGAPAEQEPGRRERESAAKIHESTALQEGR